MPVVNSDAYNMALKDKSFDIGFTLGVYMNIHHKRIGQAIDEMIRVSRKYIIHFEWDQDNTTPELKERRVFKTNIVSHNYRKLYEERGKKIIVFRTYKDFQDKFYQNFSSVKVSLWENFEGPGKYVVIVVKL